MKRAAIVVAMIAGRATADPLQLRADALTSTAAPAGLLTLSAIGELDPRLSAEAVVWTGSAGDRGHGDVLVMVLRARTQDGRASARLGRFVEALGALRPIQVDGAAGRVRLPLALDAEVYAGVPVELGLTSDRTWSWVAGGRVARRLGDYGSLGVAYAQQRDDGRVVSEEAGIDAGATLTRHDDVGARLAYDLANPGLAELALTASHRGDAVRTELYAGERSAAHLLPATSLFSVLGDVAARRAGAVVTWRAAPRLDVIADLGARQVDRTALPFGSAAGRGAPAVDGELAPAIVARARLLLDARGASALTGELRRDGMAGDAWTGARGAARIALPYRLAVSTELELVVPDHARGRGAVWPWGLAALAWDDGTWQAAIAIEADASPEDRYRLDVLGQLGRRWGAP